MTPEQFVEIIRQLKGIGLCIGIIALIQFIRLFKD